MDLGADIHLPIGPDIAPVKPGPDQQRRQTEEGYEEQEGAKEIGKKGNVLDT